MSEKQATAATIQAMAGSGERVVGMRALSPRHWHARQCRHDGRRGTMA
ncbi:hypothetical protein ABUK37_11930 [Xanthomonas citri pv. mangiferaeindicae]